LRRWVDRVACILPFEEKFFSEHGVNATFVGHPLFDELPPRKVREPGERFPARPPVIGLLAGSRKSEAEGNFPGMLEAARRIFSAHPGATFLVPTTAGTHPIVQRLLATDKATGPVTWNGLPIEFGEGRFDEFVPRCDLCLTVSGTATLHVAAFGVPMVVVYRVGALTWHLAGRWLVPTRTFALVNVLARREGISESHIVPELVPWTQADLLAGHAMDLLSHPAKLEAQRADLARLVALLDRPGASLQTAKLALSLIPSTSDAAAPKATE
jgi:lipid-A-disaccharide synthase